MELTYSFRGAPSQDPREQRLAAGVLPDRPAAPFMAGASGRAADRGRTEVDSSFVDIRIGTTLFSASSWQKLISRVAATSSLDARIETRHSGILARSIAARLRGSAAAVASFRRRWSEILRSRIGAYVTSEISSPQQT